ncbi:UDP-N-acetylmuramate--L-alanine ligase [Parafilimonas terrae]|uniref:UDP-N-acetylmuramate--L-alanine ligase n=1 Tax=Parafilimonas terrae TaxID=1465490 RepID=A0A1I5ZAK7_9BACT|nr:UDP-N-acetylmuramate--L-alanine ligase [Parafilimonas terrae]SFQ53157.1 UDP-N-acetylmuramate--L-alanine ligase [Parafilimonas terrae]
MNAPQKIKQFINSPSGNVGDVVVYFIGIGGIGMSALARYFKTKGAMVTGYDRTVTPLTQQLEAEDIDVHFEEDINMIPKNADVVVYTPAIPSTHKELVYYKENNYTVVKRSDVLQWITESSYDICVGGTHGKTTVTTMIAHMLRDSGYGCNAFLGGIAANYQTNFWSSDNNVDVIEADEYDRSFLKLSPDIAVITAMDADHLDIYGTLEEVENAFVAFTKRIHKDGCLISKYGLNRSEDLTAATHYTYCYDNKEADVYADDIKVEDGAYKYNVISKDWELYDVELHMGGLHNIENSLAAITVCKYLEIDDSKIKKALKNFKGIHRRFEYALKNNKHVLIDDYGHHPAEVKAALTGVRSLFPEEKITVIFQPHLFSRTNDFADEFAKSLDIADEVVLLPIYPAREKPMEGVTSQLILDKMQLPQKQLLDKNAMLDWVKLYKPQLVIMLGAGDIDALVQPVKKILEL